MAHHARLVQRRLAVEDDNVAVLQVAVHLAVDLGRARRREANVGPGRGREALRRRGRLGREELLRVGRAVLDRHALERDEVAVLHLDEGGARVLVRPVDDGLLQLLVVVRRDGLRERELARKDGRHADLVCLDVDVGRDDGASGIVDALALWKEARCGRGQVSGCSTKSRHRGERRGGRTIMFLRNRPSFFSRSCLTPGVGSLPCLTGAGFLPESIIELTAIWRSISASYSCVEYLAGSMRGLPSSQQRAVHVSSRCADVPLASWLRL